jgi:CheY-like chemotaxis protein
MGRKRNKDDPLVEARSNHVLRIVYADDDEQVRDTVTDLLRCLGVEVHVCENGAEAVLLCVSVGPDVALLDLTMPGMDGFESAVRIRQNDVDGQTRLVALSGHIHAHFMEKARSAGFTEFLNKPVTLQMLESAVQRWRELPRAG